MTTRDYPRLGIEEFGKHLIQSGDLDPVYIALYTMMGNDTLGEDQLDRWLLAYSCLYHCGAASWLSEYEGYAFFDKLEVAARNEREAPGGGRWPRAKERRHWRGQQAIDSCKALVDRYKGAPQGFMDYVAYGDVQPNKAVYGSCTFESIAGRVQEHRGFGRWIAFKLADMVDRLGIREVVFNFDDVVIYDDPIIAAEMLVRQRLKLPEGVNVKRSAVKEVFEYLQEYFSDYAAPPIYDRPIGLAEIETCCCKWKSHFHGHYPLNNDIREIREGIAPWVEHSETAAAFLAAMPALKEDLHVAA